MLVRIFCADFYMSPVTQGLDIVYNDFRASAVHQVPIIRIFGSSESGQKTCLHIHGVFPYVYIPFEDSEPSTSVMYKVATKLDQALNTAIGQSSSNTQHIYKIVLVSGIPIYGYHSQEHQFLKIYFYNPLCMKKACNLLQNGNILGKTYQLHEAHIPFVLQFMIDYNLHGMNYISLSEVHYRVDPDNPNLDIAPEFLLPANVTKTSTCQIEVDGLAEHIVNRLEVAVGKIVKNPGISALWEDEKQRRRNKNEDSQISQCITQTRINVPPTESHILFRNVLKEKLLITDKKKCSTDQSDLVYPAETPKTKHILSASFVESHSSLSSQSTLCSTSMESTLEMDPLNHSVYDNTFNNTSFNTSSAKDLFEVLRDLGENVDADKDSILSQISKHSEESDEEAEVDMTLPLASTITPTKIITNENVEGYINLPAASNGNEQPGSENASDVYPINLSLQEDQVNTSKTQSNSICRSLSEQGPDKVKRQLNFIEIDIASTDKLTDSNQHIISEDTQDDGDSLPRSLQALANSNSLQQREELYSEKMYPVSSSQFEKCTKTLETALIEKKIDNKLFSKAEDYDMDRNYVCIAGTSKQHECFKTNELCMKTKGMSQLEQQTMVKYSGQFIGCNSVNKQDDHYDEEISNNNTSKIISTMRLLPDVKHIPNLNILTQSLTSNVECSINVGDGNILMPKFNPPSKDMIKLTMQEYDIPKQKYQKPFYSDFADVTGEVQIGHNVLNIGSISSGLLNFEYHIANRNLQQLRKQAIQTLHPNLEITHNNIKKTKLSFCDNVNCIVTISKFPPTRLEVNMWLKAKNLKEKHHAVVNKQKKLKILLPSSPGGKSDSDDGDCITLSPLCSTDESVICKSTENEESLHQTPKRSMRIRKNKTAKKNCIFKQKSQSKSQKIKSVTDCSNKNSCKVNNLGTSLLQSHYLNHISSSSEISHNSGQITGVAPNNTHGFKMSLENLQNAKAVSEHQGLTVLVIEAHIHTRSDFKPDPQLDPIRAIFYTLFNDVPTRTTQSSCSTGIIAVDLSGDNISKTDNNSVFNSCDIIYVDSETNLMNEFVKLVRLWDPDICAGYEIEQLSWGYLIDRGNVLGINLQLLLARTSVKLNFTDDESNSDIKLTGRVLLNVWRLMRHEIALQSYTFENVMYHVLHIRIPLYSFKDLSFWWDHRISIYRHRTVQFYLCRVEGILKLFDQLDLIGRTCELARLFGIQFYEVLSRGSQFRVESMMLRLAKPLNFIAVSPSVQQRAHMKAPESLPLILEPESKFFTDPVIVLDFQSLYPSIIIAYNYCFCTCLGKVERLGQNMPFEFAATQLKISNARLKRLVSKNLINFSPCGVAFVKSDVRQGILPRMLLEILETRLMVKNSMKRNKGNKLLQRVLHSRQLGLKLIANVTYGYTAAHFSGRMPAVEVGDSVVSKGRETLLRAIKLIESTPCWGAKVVYGDTDSVFVLVPGRSRECAFKIGTEIAEAVTNANPSPVKLKLEKVYHPCILQTKKRYVGYAYETADQTEPEFCAKGIETVRRDGCPAVSKMLEKCLKILFDTKDVSVVRKYVVRQFSKLLTGRVSLQDLTFAKEYRGAMNYRPGACVPALELTRKWIAVDKRSEPRCGERVPYIIINGPPGLPLIKLVRSPRELLADSSLLPNVLYYITRVIIPPLNRCFTLIGVDLHTWFNNMPRKQMQIVNNVTPDTTSKKGAISHYFSTTTCIICSQQAQHGLCVECCNSPQQTIAILQNKINDWEWCYSNINKICNSCCGGPTSINCISLDCPVLYCMSKTNKDFQQVTYVRQMISTVLNLDTE